MGIAFDFFAVFASAAVLLITAEFAVKNSIKLAKHFRLSDEFIGMTILAIGTSIPEIITHIVGSYEIVKNPGAMNKISSLVIGANVGSDIFQQNFLIGLVALIGIIIVDKNNLVKDVGSLIAASVLLLLFSIGGFISRPEGFVLFGGYISYLFYLKKYGIIQKRSKIEAGRDRHILKHTSILLVSFVIMAAAADRMLNYSSILVEELHISASFFGVLILGIVSAFPELTTSIVAGLRRKARISAGILIGSNITNPMFALGIGALISGYTVPNVVVWFDLPIKIATALLLFIFLRKGKLSKNNAFFLIASYLVYLYLRNQYFPVDFV